MNSTLAEQHTGPESLLFIQDLKKAYGPYVVVDIPQLQVGGGEAIGLVGNNGAGKTTLFRLMLDLIRAETGAVFSKGANVAQSEHWKDYTASYLDEGFLIDYLKPEEYFEFIIRLYQLNRVEAGAMLERYSEFFNDEIMGRGKYIRDLSKGNQSKVGVVGALLQKPQVLLLDEPFANIDPSTQIRLKKLLKEASALGTTVFVSSHDLNHVTDVCDRILLMEKGRIIKDLRTDSNTLEELKGYFSV